MPDFKWHGKELENKVKRVNGKALVRASLHVVRKAKQIMPGSGIANANKAQREANRSTPGEPPHVQTGTLKRSIGFEIVNKFTGDEGHIGARLGFKASGSKISSSTYGKWLEIGTRLMAARPHLRPALIKSRFKIIREFAKIL